MSCRHHPQEDTLLSYASGALDEASSLVIATHLTLCPHCRADVSVAEAVGGMLLDEMAPAEIKGFAAIINRLNETGAVASPLTHTNYPRTLDAYLSPKTKWRSLGAGLRYAPLLREGEIRAGLLVCAPGAGVTLHTHDGDEMTVVLAGEYQDGDQHFQMGDVQCTDATVMHHPVAHSQTGCTVLLLNKGRLRPKSFLARIFLRLLPL